MWTGDGRALEFIPPEGMDKNQRYRYNQRATHQIERTLSLAALAGRNAELFVGSEMPIYGPVKRLMDGKGFAIGEATVTPKEISCLYIYPVMGEEAWQRRVEENGVAIECDRSGFAVHITTEER